MNGNLGRVPLKHGTHRRRDDLQENADLYGRTLFMTAVSLVTPEIGLRLREMGKGPSA